MFYIGPHRINPPFLLAPMAQVSEMPFRVLALEMGAGLATTELISAKGIVHQNARTQKYLRYNKEIERPFSVQLFGGEIDAMAKAAEYAVRHGADIIDVNMGCPVKKVTKTGAGSALMCEPKRAHDLIVAMRRAVSDQVPITAKIRSGWDADSINCITMGKALEDAGCAAVAMHARTRAQGYSGQADWRRIAELKAALQIPVIGNGDVTSVEAAHNMLALTGCDGVMIGRAALGNPWIFEQLKSKDCTAPSPEEKLRVLLRHFEDHLAFHHELDDRHKDPYLGAIRSFRSHMVWYSKGLYGAGHFREKIMQLEDRNEVMDVLHTFFTGAQCAVEAASPEVDDVDYRQAFG